MLSYWLKVIGMDPNRLPFKCYVMLKRLDENEGKFNWVSKIRSILNMNGFGYVWLNQGVDNKRLFLKAFEQRCKDVYSQEWRTQIDSRRRCFYLNIKHVIIAEKYIELVSIFRHRRCISMIRISSHNLNVNKRVKDESLKICRMCNRQQIEDEYHFCLVCPAYRVQRESLLSPYYWRNPSPYKLYKLLTNVNVYVNLSKLLFVSFKKRKSTTIV